MSTCMAVADEMDMLAVGMWLVPTCVAVELDEVGYSRVWRDGRWTWLVFTCKAVAVGSGLCQRVRLWELGVVGGPRVGP